MGRPPVKTEPLDSGELTTCKWTTFVHIPVNETDSKQPEVISVAVDWWPSLKQAKEYMKLGAQGNQCDALLNHIGDQSYDSAAK